MASKNKIIFSLVILACCHSITTSIDTEIIVNTTVGMIYMDSFVAHEKSYSSLQQIIKNKVKSAIEDIVVHSKLDSTQLFPNIHAMEYTMLQLLHFLDKSDLPFVQQLVESLQYLSVKEYPAVFSNLVNSNIVYNPSEMYRVAKSLQDMKRSRFNTIPKSIEEGIMSMMNKSEILLEASKRGDIVLMKWLLLSENDLDLNRALNLACLQKRLDIVRLLIGNDKLSNRLRIINISNCSKETLLRIAVMSQSRDFLSILIREGVSVNVHDTDGFSPLQLAVKHNDLIISKVLIERGANVNQETVEGNTALHEACRKGMVDIAELLINAGSNAFHKNKYGISPIMMSEKFVIINILRYLFNNKVNIPNDNLLCSIYFISPDGGEEEDKSQDELNIESNKILRNSELVDQMKSRVISDSCQKVGIKETLLNITMINLMTPFVKSLINLGVRLDVESEATKDVFMDSIKKGSVDMTTLMLNKGISANTTTEGLPALHIAAMNGQPRIFHLLMERGANILSSRSNGQTILHSACEGKQKSIVEYLIRKDFDVNKTDSHGSTPLEVAAYSGNYDIVATLVKSGANVRYRGTVTPLIAATISGNIKSVNFLLDNGADIEEKANFGMTPLLTAVNKGYEDVVEALLNRGASFHAKDSLGNTALHIAAKKGSVKMVKMLLQRGDRNGVENSEGKTALDVALPMYQIPIIELLSYEVENRKD